MEKLEEILRAEEDARHVLGEAHDQAAEIGRKAAADAERIHAEAKTGARQEIHTLRANLLRDADEEAGRITSRSEHALGGLVRSAESRIETAVEAAVTEITG